MISQVTFKSAIISAGFRIAKVLGYGNTALTADDCSPFGIDSSAVQNLVAVYAETEEAGDTILIGYLNPSALAQPGETRIYSKNPSNGALSTSIWLRTDGIMELAGNTNNMVRYTPLDEGIANKDILINTELTKIAAAIAALGGTYVPGSISTDISLSKIDQIKCI